MLEADRPAREVEALTEELRKARVDNEALRRERDSLARELERALGRQPAPPPAPGDDPPAPLRRVSVADTVTPRATSAPAIPLSESQLGPVFAGALVVTALVVLSWLVGFVLALVLVVVVGAGLAIALPTNWT